jgi:hypothetical protein
MSTPSFHLRLPLILVVALLIAIIGIAPAAAQTIPIPIAAGENRTGDLNSSAPAATYSLNSTGSETVIVQVLALAPGLSPTIRVTDPGGVTVLDVPNPTGGAIVQSSLALTTPGVYLVEVRSASNASGQFVISVQAGAPLAPPTPLTPGVAISGVVNAQTVQQSYRFISALDEVMVLVVRAENDAAPVIVLYDEGEPQPIAVSSSALLGARYRIPPGDRSYQVRVSYGGGQAAALYSVCIGFEDTAPQCPDGGAAPQLVPTVAPLPTLGAPTVIPPTVIPPTVILAPTFPPNECVASPAGSSTINVRALATTNSAIIGTLQAGQFLIVTGRTSDNGWFRVNFNGVIAWVASSVAVATGNCAGVQIVATPFPTSTPSLTPTIGLSSATPTFTPTLTGTVAPTLTPTIQATLNFSLPANYGSTALTSGFVPDPFTRGITSGGSVDVSYLGGGCRGYATPAPDFSVNFTSGAFPTLRFYFIGGGDTTMIINSPSGSYFCNDDSFGTLNPTIDFNSPASGRYDIWIGSFASGSFVSGTLYVTESTGNHP